MVGSCFIIYPEGWSCSYEAVIDIEKDLVRSPEGVMMSRSTNTLKINGIFIGAGEIKKDKEVDCLFKADGADSLLAYKGRIVGMGGDLTIINLLQSLDNIQDLVHKIKI